MGNSNKKKRNRKKKKKKNQREEGSTSLFTTYHNTPCVDLKGDRGGGRAIEQGCYSLR